MRAGHLLVASLVLSTATSTPLAAQTHVGAPSVGSRLRVFTRGDRPTRFVGSVVRVTNLTNGRAVEVRIVDRGPAPAIRQRGVIIDVSRAAAQSLGFISAGRTRVRVEVLK